MSVITRDNKIEYFLRRREEEYSLNAFSATPPVSEGSAVVCPLLHGFTLTLFGHHPRLSIVRLRRRRLWVDADAEEAMRGD